MTAAHKQLLFSDVDELAFAAVRGKLDKAIQLPTYEPRQLGPLLEFLHLSAGGRLPRPKNWLSLMLLRLCFPLLNREKIAG